MSNAGQVSVRFSVQDAEVVRKALADLGKDGEKAMKSFDASAQPINKSLGFLNAVSNQLKGSVVGLAVSIGPLGYGLLSLGPAGLVAAGAIGGIIALVNVAIERANKFGSEVRSLKDAAEVLGLTTDQLNALSVTAARVGVDSQETVKFIQRLTVNLDALRQGGGPLFDQLIRIDTGLVRQLASTKSTAEAWDILAKAVAGADTVFQKNALIKAIGGGRGVEAAGVSQLLDFTAINGGLEQVTKNVAAAGDGIDANLVKRVSQLKIEIDATNKRAETMVNSMFSEEVLRRQLDAAQAWERMARSAKEMAEAQSGLTWYERFFQAISEASTAASPVANKIVSEANQQAAARALLAKRLGQGDRSDLSNIYTPAGMAEPAKPKAPAPAASPGASAAVNLALMQRWTNVLGSAITPTETLRLEQARLAAEIEKGGVSAEVAIRALNAINLAQEQTALATRERLGIASQEEIELVGLRVLQDQRAKSFIKSDAEMTQAEQNLKRTAEDTTRAIQIRNSALPGMTAFALDAANMRSQIDRTGTETLGNINNGIVDFITRTKTGSEAIRDFGAQFARTLANMVVQMTIMAPIAAALKNTLSGGMGGFSVLSLFGFAEGGIMTPTGPMPLNIRGFADGGICGGAMWEGEVLS